MRSRNATYLTFVFCFLLAPSSPIRATAWFTFGSGSTNNLVAAALVNITIDDASSLVMYSPKSSWHSSAISCPKCLAPDQQLAYAQTWHEGTNASIRDGDDSGDTDTRVGSSSNSPSTMEVGVKSSDGSDDLTDTSRHDGPPSVSSPVLVQFSFNGSAVYVFALVPMFAAAANGPPTSMNLTSTLDSQPAGTFIHLGSNTSAANTSLYQSSVPVFVKTGISEGPHTVTINIGPDSALLLDYIVYSQEDSTATNKQDNIGEGASSSPNIQVRSSTVSTRFTMPSGASTQSSTASHSNTHSVATFAGAVGGSVGLLSLLALSLAISLYRRRRLARRRDRAYREARNDNASISDSFHTNASEDGPPMQGPAPFVPRYFPGTVINTAPPPYSPRADTSMLQTSPLLGEPETPSPSMAWSSRRLGLGIEGDTSYADRPPPTPPLGFGMDVEEGFFAPPPSFPVAISTPVPAILAGLSNLLTPPPSSSSSSPSPTPRSSSPVVPLLAPPPSSRPQGLLQQDERSAAGPSESQGQPSSIAPSSQSSVHTIYISTTSLRSPSSRASTRNSISSSLLSSPEPPPSSSHSSTPEDSQQEPEPEPELEESRASEEDNGGHL